MGDLAVTIYIKSWVRDTLMVPLNFQVALCPALLNAARFCPAIRKFLLTIGVKYVAEQLLAQANLVAQNVVLWSDVLACIEADHLGLMIQSRARLTRS